jgi:hypothetical protein
MYVLTPIVSKQVIFKAVLKIKKEDSRKIIDNLELLIGESDINVIKEENDKCIHFFISSSDQRSLEVFYFKISSIANDNYLRRNKIEKNKST